MKILFIVLFLAMIHLSAYPQETQFLIQRMKGCFAKEDSLKKVTKARDRSGKEYTDDICHCLEGSIVDDFTFTTLKGDSMPLSSFRNPVVIFLFARFCAPCMAEIPAINWLYRKYSGEIDFIGITPDSRKQLESYSGKYEPGIILVPSPSEDFRQSWAFRIFSDGIKSLPIPTLYFIDKQKIITNILVGAFEEFHPAQYGITDPGTKEITKAQADSTNISEIEIGIQLLLGKK